MPEMDWVTAICTTGVSVAGGRPARRVAAPARCDTYAVLLEGHAVGAIRKDDRLLGEVGEAGDREVLLQGTEACELRAA